MNPQLLQLLGLPAPSSLIEAVLGGGAVSVRDARHLEKINTILKGSLGDHTWKYVVSLITDEKAQKFVLGVLNADASTKAKTLASAKDQAIEVIDKAIERKEAPERVALCQCPDCGFYFGMYK